MRWSINPKQRHPRMPSALVLAVAVAGCGGAGLPDPEVLDAVPASADLMLASPADAPASGATGTRQDRLLGTSELFPRVVGMIEEVNRTVLSVTHGVDEIRSQPPTHRDGNRLVWGPSPDPRHEGVLNRFVLVRNEEADGPVYAYALQQRREGMEDFADVIVGAFRGERSSGGQGEFRYLGEVARHLETADDPLLLGATLGYRYERDGAHASLRALRLDPRTGLPSEGTVAFAVGAEGGGGLEFQALADLPGSPTPAPERQVIDARWLPSHAGRIAAAVAGGDLGEGAGHYVECIDEQLRQVFRAFEFRCGADRCDACPDGARACSGAEGEPERCAIGSCGDL